MSRIVSLYLWRDFYEFLFYGWVLFPAVQMFAWYRSGCRGTMVPITDTHEENGVKTQVYVPVGELFL